MEVKGQLHAPTVSLGNHRIGVCVGVTAGPDRLFVG
jgi:hypothetical protein